MREIAFIKQNKEKWLEFEQAIFGESKKSRRNGKFIHSINE